jgi:glutamyl-tRNA synthetase
MEITHVLRGEDLLSSTPRQLALYGALKRIGVTEFTPNFGHLPFVMGEGNKKLSKRDPESNLFHHRDRGFIPEGLLNYLALLGWSAAADRDVFSIAEMVQKFEVSAVSSNPARFDQKKADAINAEHIRLLEPADFTARLRAYLQERHGLPAEVDEAAFAAAAELVQTRIVVLGDAWALLKFLYVGDAFAVDPAAAAKNLKGEADAVLDAAGASLGALEQWTTAAIEESLKTSLIDGLGLKPRNAFAPVRVAVTGSHISPPLFESMELLGRDLTLARLAGARALVV